MNMLEVERVNVRFGATRVLTDLSFAVPQGAGIAVVGPNGSGKTVLFRALIGAIPYEGSIRWAPGTRIGYVPQKLDLERDLPITGRDLLRARASSPERRDGHQRARSSPASACPPRRAATRRSARSRAGSSSGCSSPSR